MISLLSRRMASNRVAVLFAGCGVYDGTEVHEASATLAALGRNKAQVRTYSLMYIIIKFTGGSLISPNLPISPKKNLRNLTIFS